MEKLNVFLAENSGHKSKWPFFQPKLTVNTPGDAYEQEADAVAERVMGMQSGEVAQPQALSLTPVAPIQRQCAECEKEELQRQEEDSEEKEVQLMHIASSADDTIQRQCAACEQEEAQRKETGGGDASGKAAPGIVNDVLSSGGGQAMDGGTRQFMESRFGHDFGQVRIHTDSRAAESATAIQAKAYTSGRDIVFGQGQYQPESDSGKRLLAHELAHVGQQGGRRQRVSRLLDSCDSSDWRDFWITIYFRIRANERTMQEVRAEVNDAKAILERCCLRLKVNYNWRLLPGGGTFNYGGTRPDGMVDYSNDADTLGSGTTFDGSRGLPVLVVDDVPGTGGGVTVTSGADPDYHGRTYAVIATNQSSGGGSNDACSSLAHELWHVIGNLNHDSTSGGDLAACTSNDLSEEFCSDMRDFVAPVGDFPSPRSDFQYA